MIKTCTILTTQRSHRRSARSDACDLERKGLHLWRDPGLNDTADILEMLKPYDALQMSAYPVSSRVHQVENDDADCAKPVEQQSPPQGQLFG